MSEITICNNIFARRAANHATIELHVVTETVAGSSPRNGLRKFRFFRRVYHWSWPEPNGRAIRPSADRNDRGAILSDLLSPAAVDDDDGKTIRRSKLFSIRGRLPVLPRSPRPNSGYRITFPTTRRERFSRAFRERTVRHFLSFRR